jgi:putative Ca2+/H+ antiporter (TMEM165/GDT1 family)
MAPNDLDTIRQGVLDRIERHDRNVQLAVIAAAIFEGALLLTAFMLVEWSDRTQVIIVVMSVLTYTTIALGLVALGAHVSRAAARVLLAISPEPTR